MISFEIFQIQPLILSSSIIYLLPDELIRYSAIAQSMADDVDGDIMEELLAGPLDPPTSPTHDLDRFPHMCPRCGGPAYIGGMDNVDCHARCH